MTTRRDFIKTVPPVLLFSSVFLESCANKNRYDKLRRNHWLYSYIGEDGLEGVLQEEFDKGTEAILQIKSTPNMAQLDG